MKPIVKQLAQEYKAALQHLFGADFVELIVFGPYARGDSDQKSTVDFAVVIKRPAINTAEELLKARRIDSLLVLKYGIMLSTLPVLPERLETSMLSIYQQIRKEGIVI